MLVKQRGALDEILEDAPLALNNLALTYNPQAGTLDTRANLGELGNQITNDPAALLCGIVEPGRQRRRRCATLIQQALPRTGAFGQGPRPAPPDRLRPDARWTRGGAAMKPRSRPSCWRCSPAALLLTGCDFDVYKLPLPGGTDVGRRPDHGAR